MQTIISAEDLVVERRDQQDCTVRNQQVLGGEQ